MRKAVLLLGSPGRGGKTEWAAQIVQSCMEGQGWSFAEFRLFDMILDPCVCCLRCQQSQTSFRCPQDDDMHRIFDAFLRADLLIPASPVCGFFCTSPMKTALDRLYFGARRFDGEKEISLLEGKKCALICGGSPDREGADLWEESIRRICSRTRMKYLGMLVETDSGYDPGFPDEGAEARARAFADRLCEAFPDAATLSEMSGQQPR